MTRRHRLGALDRIPPGEGRVFAVDGRHVAVFRARDGRVFATTARCPHRGGPLADGILGHETVACPMHGIEFDLTTGSCSGGRTGDVVAYRTEVVDGEIELTIAD